MSRHDDEDNKPAYLSPRWHAQRLAHEAAAAEAAKPKPVPIPAVYQQYLADQAKHQEHVSKPKRIGSSPMAKRVHELRGTWRICDMAGCGKNTDGMSSLCFTHRERRRRYGSPKLTRAVRHRQYAHWIGRAVKYLKANPPSASMIEAMQRFLIPPGQIPRGKKGHKARALLISELARWADPRYRNKWTDYGEPRKRGRGVRRRTAYYTPRQYLAVCVGVYAFIEEYQCADDGFIFARALCRMHRRPGRRGVSARLAKAAPPGPIKTNKYPQKVSASVLRGIVERWRGFATLGLYVLQTARTIYTEWKSEQAVRNAKLAKAPPVAALPPGTRVIPVLRTPQPLPLPERVPSPSFRPVVLFKREPTPLPPRYPKPIHAGRTTADITKWQHVEALWAQYPEGYIP